MSDVLRVGMVGYAFMGSVHAQASPNAHRFFDLPLTPELTAVAGRNPEAVSSAAERLGFAWTEFVKSRPLSGERSGLGGLGGSSADSPRADVTVDDAALFTARFAGGATGVLEATRFALGRKNVLRIEINGTDGSLAFDFEENNLLQFFDGTQPVEEQGFRRILVTEPEHPYVGAWWPPGHGLGYEHGFTHQVVDLVAAIADNRQPTPSFDDGLRVQRVLGAVEDSAARDSAWTTV
jgi:predicted dehydrogenase